MNNVYVVGVTKWVETSRPMSPVLCEVWPRANVEQMQCVRGAGVRVLVSVHPDLSGVLWEARRGERQEQLCAHLRASRWWVIDSL